MVSTRGRYALRVMIDLAENSQEKYIAMREVARRQRISLKYMERLLPVLVAEGMVQGVKGKGGGYKLTRSPGEYSIGEILRVMEGDFVHIPCVSPKMERSASCNEAECRTFPMWKELNNRINDYLDSVSLADLMKQQ